MLGAASLLMFPALLFALFIGFPVAFAMIGVAFGFGYWAFGPSVIYQFIQKVDAMASNFVLAAVPLFVFMGAMLERAGIAERLFEAIHLWTRRLPGGLAIGTVLMCVVFAASSGVIGATETVVGLLTIPVMLKYKYDKSLISGVICAGGSLGTIIPPSIVVVLLGPVANVSIGDLMFGMLIPGLLLALLYILYILVLCVVWPDKGPRIPPSPDDPPFLEKVRISAIALWPPMLLIMAVLGSIMFGIAAPTEAAALGALGALLLSVVYGDFSLRVLNESLIKTLKITVMILTILMAGNMFAGVFIAGGGVQTTEKLIAAANLGPWLTLAVFLFICFLAGFILDWISILLIFIPVFVPIVKSMGFDPVWFCVLFLIIIQTSYLSPPMAPAIFYLRGIAPPEITINHMFLGVVPFITVQFVCLIIVAAFPQLVLWLPTVLLGFR
ncbi:TRAP transporter large permease subunit [Hyphomicrobium sp. CS1BSMeth3]|uniref:TRAP transporter large permease n=1 Tax=Hyphomicrobium sp. CS1BSMeth3 TaxID=1892844 RepID=UPI0009305FA7|nr:TRAP transporter large permease subunit [Hyphomicrobium sp. CS1BSMeth3]